MHWEVWTAYAVMETALCLAPGPAVLLVLSQGLARGTLASIWSNLGILSGNAIYFLLSAVGLGAVLIASYDLFFAIKWIGAGYLIWLGVSAFVGRSPILSVRRDDSQAALSGARMYLNGIILQLSNPKALVFFTALLPQFVDPAVGVAKQVVILAVTSFAIEFIVLAGYGALAGRVTHMASRPRFASLTNRTAGTMLIAAGVGIARIRRA